jgi:hypothetical protein
MNDDRLSFSEAVRIRQQLNDIDIHLHRIIINKAQHGEIPEEIRREFTRHTIEMFPYSPQQLLGLQSITEYIEANKTLFPEKLTKYEESS